MPPHALFARALRARHGNSMRRAIIGSRFAAVVWMQLDRHHIDARTIPADVVATIARECALAEADVRAYLRLAPCNVDGQPQRMTPQTWTDVLADEAERQRKYLP